MLNPLYENQFNLHVSENLLSYERMNTRTRFGNVAEGNSEIAWLQARRKEILGTGV